jgi:hypothetical protein
LVRRPTKIGEDRLRVETLARPARFSQILAFAYCVDEKNLHFIMKSRSSG